MAEPMQKYVAAKYPTEGDEIEKSIELLDKVLSEFEDPESLPPIEPDSPSQGHQSEDDGYMSMNGKKTSSASNVIEADGNCAKTKRTINDTKLFDDILKQVDSHTGAAPLQTTLPKARPTNVIPSKYASLPTSTPPRQSNRNDSDYFHIHGGRSVLGIGIGAVHDAVLRGIAQMPEPILNEHPVTIYPGRASPVRKVPPRTLPGLLERHRDVCRKSIDSSQELAGDQSGSKSSVNLDSSLEIDEQSIQSIIIRSPMITNHTEDGTVTGYSKTISIIPCIKADTNRQKSDEDEDFSDDSLEEGSSLPPPPQPPLVPPKPPSLSAPVTPSKRGSIAWEINLDEKIEAKANKNNSCDKFVVPNINDSQISIASTPGSITSTDHTCSSEWPDPPEPPICSTEDEAGSIVTDSDEMVPHTTPSHVVPNGTYVIRKGRKERQRLIDIDGFREITPPEIDNEHDEADSADDLADNNAIESISPTAAILTTNDDHVDSPTNLLLRQQLETTVVPNYRNSIDLALPIESQFSSAFSPRARLSLNLNLPTSDRTDSWAYRNNSINMNNTNNNSNNNNYNVNVAPTPSSSSSLTRNCESNFKAYRTPLNVDDDDDDDDDLAAFDDSTNLVALTDRSPDNNNSGKHVPALSTVTPTAPANGEAMATPRRELAPPIEEDEEQDSESQREAPLRQIENNISALLRGDIAVARVGDIAPPRRMIGFRAGVHKSESAKEMLLSQNMFGPLPPSPSPTSSPGSPEDSFPPLPPSPLEQEASMDGFDSDTHGFKMQPQSRSGIDVRYRDPHEHPPVVPPHKMAMPTLNTLKTRSMDAGFTKCYKSNNMTMSPHAPGTLPQDFPGSGHSRRRIMSGAFPKRSAQSPREERRLQTSCSLPETPIFARGCDVPRTPHRRTQELPVTGCSRTAPRQPNGLNSSIIGIAGSTLNGRQSNRSINHALASSEMLRMAGGPARGWYPNKQRHQRPASTENLDRIHPLGSMRAWDSGMSNSRKPLTLPPNLSPNFFNKSPREALRRVTSLLIRKGNNNNPKETKKEKDTFPGHLHRSFDAGVPQEQVVQKKRGFFRSFWKKSKHYSFDQ